MMHMVERSSFINTASPATLLSFANSVSTINKRYVDHLRGDNILRDKSYGFRSASSTADILSVITRRINKECNGCFIMKVSDLDNPKDFSRFAAQTTSLLDERSPLSSPFQQVVPCGSLLLSILLKPTRWMSALPSFAFSFCFIWYTYLEIFSDYL